MRTERLYYTDPYRVTFEATAVGSDAGGTRVVLDRSAFYPTSGGQPHDLGTLGGVPVLGVEDTEDGSGMVHVLASPLPAGTAVVTGEIDWQRRFDHMQQHTGQHLLSAVFIELFGIETLSFHMGAEVSTVELGTPALTTEHIEAAEQRTNELIVANRPVVVTFEDAATVTGLRKAPARTGTLRIVSIDGVDRSACGGTHVRSTAEIGFVSLRRTEKIRGNTRLEFVCGLRAVGRARQDFRLLSRISELTSTAVDETPKVVALWSERMAEAEKDRRRLALELASSRGRELYAQTASLPSGLRLAARELSALGDDVRAEAQAFTAAGPRAAYIAVSGGEKPGILFAVSGDAGANAGALLKPLLSEAGGKGGGSAQMAQGTVPERASLDRIVAALKRHFEE